MSEIMNRLVERAKEMRKNSDPGPFRLSRAELIELINEHGPFPAWDSPPAPDKTTFFGYILHVEDK